MHALRSSVGEFGVGIAVFVRGLVWLRRHPRYFVALLAPMFVGFLLLGIGWGVFLQYDEILLDRLMFARPDSAAGLFIYYAARAFLYLALVALSWLMVILLVNILSAPVYDWVSLAVERSMLGDLAVELGFWASLRLVGEEIKKALFVIMASILLLLIPGFNVLSTLTTAFLIGWNFCDYPLARRGWPFSRRLSFALRNFWSVTGFGIWLLIPFFQFVLMPLAVVGGTILNLEKLQHSANEAAGKLSP